MKYYLIQAFCLFQIALSAIFAIGGLWGLCQ